MDETYKAKVNPRLIYSKRETILTCSWRFFKSVIELDTSDSSTSYKEEGTGKGGQFLTLGDEDGRTHCLSKSFLSFKTVESLGRFSSTGVGSLGSMPVSSHHTPNLLEKDQRLQRQTSRLPLLCAPRHIVHDAISANVLGTFSHLKAG